jgi:phage gp36-like protein
MSQYATATELKQLGLPAEALVDVLDADIDAQIEASCGVIDAYLMSRVTLPIAAPYPDLLKRFSVDMAAFHILMRRGFNPEAYDGNYKELHDRAEEFFKDFAAGRVNIPDLIDATPDTVEGAPMIASGTARGW